MSLIVLGINHKTAPVEIREQLSFNSSILSSALTDLLALPNVNEAAILSTCNRTEIYSDLIDEDINTLILWLAHYHKLSEKDIIPYIYSHFAEKAIQHILRVACGLDSMILGEPQILGQMKQTFQSAQQAKTIHSVLHKLFEYSFRCAKQVRTDTKIGESTISVAFAAVSLAKQIFSQFSSHTALLIGAGETIELVARHLQEHNIGRMIIANRTLENAHQLASDFNAYAIALSELPYHLAEADIIISSTGSPLPILGKGSIESAIKKRKYKPMLMVDIAVPRDIEPEVKMLEDVFLYTVDDLQEIIDEGLQSRQQAALKAEEIVDTQVMHFIHWLQSLHSINVIKKFRQQAEGIAAQAQQKALKQLANGQPPEAVITELTKQLTNKLIHTPCIQIKQAGINQRYEILDLVRELFNLPKNG